MTAFATPADMIQRVDVRELGDLVSDNLVRVGPAELLTHANLLTALEDAAGEMRSALQQAGRYTDADLAALTGSSLSKLKRLNCIIARGFLWERREWSSEDERQERYIEAAKKTLDRLRTGVEVFDIQKVKDAGLPGHNTPRAVAVRLLDMAVDKARHGYYMTRRDSRA